MSYVVRRQLQRSFLAAAAVALLVAPAASCAPQAAPTGDLLILQSSPDPMALSMSKVGRGWPDAMIIASDDCPELRPKLYVIASRAGAAGGTEAKGKAPGDAYVRKCTVKADSLTKRGIPAVDPSFAKLGAPPVNFGGEAMVTRIQDGLLVRPWYQPDPEDPREGLRVAVEDLHSGRRVIERDCVQPEVARSATHIAVACAFEQVAEQPVYRTTLYGAKDLAKLRVVPRCRRPQLSSKEMRCTSQAVGGDGEIGEGTHRVAL